MARRDDLLLVELGEILRLSSAPHQTMTAVANAIGAHEDVALVVFAAVDLTTGHALAFRGYQRKGVAAPHAFALAKSDRDSLLAGRMSSTETSLIWPLMRGRECVAILFVGATEPRVWDPTTVAVIGEVAEHAWLWVERDRLVNELLESQRALEQRVADRTRDLDRSLREKTVLLKEVHHRVKNNLQVVSSLLSLQRGRIEDPIARRVLEDSQARVRSMALVHEKLYRSKDLASVRFDDYVRDLAAQLWHSLGAYDRRIAMNLELVEVSLTIDQAIPCGLVLNELVTNALKHAKPTAIAIELRSDGDRCTFAIRDDGIGLPEGFSLEAVTSFGMDMVMTFIEQLDATIEIVRASPGTEVRVTFPLATA